MDREFKRSAYLQRLIDRKHNHLVKVITGVRRCGKSYLLNTLFKRHLLESGIKENHIIEMSFDLYRNAVYRDPEVFFPWVVEQLKDDEMYYILLDEVQLLGEFVSILNDFAARGNCDVYVTGSNAKFLSKDIATEFGGRSSQLKLHPLSFSEFMSVWSGNELQGMFEYLRYGGVPLVVLKSSEEEKRATLKDLMMETYLRDVIERNKLHNISELNELVRVLASTIGGLMNPTKLQNTFRSKIGSSITAPTLTKYIDYLKDAFLIEEVRRYDIKGRAYIGTPMKYYFSDLGLANAQLDFRQEEIVQTMENAVYNELRMRGFEVDIGNLAIAERNSTGTCTKKFVEVDFVCNKNTKRYYIQVAHSLGDEAKRAQEIRPFLKINDLHKKIIVTFSTPAPFYTEEGVLVMSIFDFMRTNDSLDSF